MPMPTPPVGGIPWQIASMNSSSRGLASSSPACFFLRLFDEQFALQLGVVELGIGVAHFAAENKALKALDEVLLCEIGVAVEFAKGGGLDRVVDDVVGLDQMLFGKFLKEHGDESAAGGVVDLFGIDVASLRRWARIFGIGHLVDIDARRRS